jgi:hypothetical protein
MRTLVCKESGRLQHRAGVAGNDANPGVVRESESSEPGGLQGYADLDRKARGLSRGGLQDDADRDRKAEVRPQGRGREMLARWPRTRVGRTRSGVKREVRWLLLGRKRARWPGTRLGDVVTIHRRCKILL